MVYKENQGVSESTVFSDKMKKIAFSVKEKAEERLN